MLKDIKNHVSKRNNEKLKIVNDTTEKESSNQDTNDGNTIIHHAKRFLNENYHLRFNTISLDIQAKGISENKWKPCNENSIWIKMQENGIKIGFHTLKAILRTEFVPEFNPLKDYFEKLPQWDGQTDYISRYANYIELSKNEDFSQFLYHFKKWCVRAVKSVFYEGFFNKQAFVLTDDGKGQNIGKTTWCRYLCPDLLSDYLAEDINSTDKDARILLCKNFLINLDELAALSKKEINQLKSLFSKAQINERLPYDAKNSVIPRVASFIGSTNMSTFLHDETGSVRWLCFVVDDIDRSYKPAFNVDFLWSQAYALTFSKDFDSELTREDIRKNEERNDKFQHLSKERELIEQYLQLPENENSEFLTATQISTYLRYQSGEQTNHIQIGKALKACKFERVKVGSSRGYYVSKKKLEIY